MKVIHVTDPHLPEPGQTLWGLDAYGRLDACLEDIALWHADAAFCVISGDLADRGHPGAYDWLAARLAGFPVETVLMIGNHDDRDIAKARLPGLMVDEGGFVQGTRATAEGTFLFLDTFKGEGSAGRYCRQRQDWLGARLRDTPGPHRIFMHHPPMDIGVRYMDRIKLDEAAEFAALVRGRDIAHLFFGHVHRACFLTWQGIACSALPGINHQVPLVHGSTATRYSDEPPMYGVVLVEGTDTIVHADAWLDRRAVDMPS